MTDSLVGVTGCTTEIILKLHVTKLVRDPNLPSDM